MGAGDHAADAAFDAAGAVADEALSVFAGEGAEAGVVAVGADFLFHGTA